MLSPLCRSASCYAPMLHCIFFAFACSAYSAPASPSNISPTASQSLPTSLTLRQDDNVSQSPFFEVRPEPLRFNYDGAFTIATFSDLHFGENEDTLWAPEQDRKSAVVMNYILDAEVPDFVVFNGNLITGENTFAENSTHYLDRVVAPAVDHNTPWASTYGNHDNDVNISHALLLAREKQLYANLSHTASFFATGTDADNSGPANYFVPVYPAKHDASVASDHLPLLLLWFFDSRSGRGYGTAHPNSDWVDPAVASWLRSTASSLRKKYGGALPPSLAFVHIPTNVSADYQSAFVTPANGHNSLQQDPDRSGLEFPGLNDDQPLASQGSETDTGYSGQDKPFIAALKESLARTDDAIGGLFALVSGHDHGDAWCARRKDDLTVCFGRHTGYGGYGTWTRGARMFGFNLTDLKNGQLRTWIRLEDGNIIDEVILGKHFGSQYDIDLGAR